ncbi:TetR/AcrR family transcriptional regulator [Leifsonia sp. NPDC058292]|uniref:TetR/AcrR family transcriptional regulator n=1 Tax=Leifsonia sp. NPDC058292 TaxID=3346428 RepID=UPI0036D911E8
MDLVEDASPARRRRGEELENALLDAAWAELLDGGYASFTIDAVAHRAGTSRPVVYRRWATKQELLLAAIRHSGLADRPPLPDTGTLRGDVIAMMLLANETRLATAALLSVRLGSYFEETGTALADLREVMLGGRVGAMETVVARGVERGEVDPSRLTPRIVTLPFDLFRHHALMTLKPMPLVDIEEIVDTIFLPLVRPLAP